MPNSFTQLYVHYVFIVHERECALKPEIKERLIPYIVGIIHQKNCITIAINGTYDHIHILIKLQPDISVSELAKVIKANSSHWVNEIRLFTHRFHWQEGYGAFSVSQSMFETVVKYIENQVEHHKHQTVQEEYEMFLKKHRIEYNPKYLPK